MQNAASGADVPGRGRLMRVPIGEGKMMSCDCLKNCVC